jgi:hypothetical protein
VITSKHSHKCSECGKIVTRECQLSAACQYEYLVTCATCAREMADQAADEKYWVTLDNR